MREFVSHVREQGSVILVAAAAMASLAAAASPLAAQNPNAGQMAEQYAANAKANAQLTRQYTWQMRVSLTYKGTAEDPQLYQMNWDASGNLQKTLISAPPDEKKRHGIRKHIADSEIADFKKWMSDLMDLVKQYMAPTPGQMMDFYSKATITPAPTGGVAAFESGFIQPGDKATYYIDPATHKPTKYAFMTTLQADTVNATVVYGVVPNGGPQYAEQTSIEVPAKQVTAVIENFNYVKQ
jgi:hypothetical protein